MNVELSSFVFWKGEEYFTCVDFRLNGPPSRAVIKKLVSKAAFAVDGDRPLEALPFLNVKRQDPGCSCLWLHLASRGTCLMIPSALPPSPPGSAGVGLKLRPQCPGEK